MRDQLEHVARLAESLATATIGVIPFDRQLPVLVLNGWDLTDDMVAIETPLGDLDISDPGDVSPLQRLPDAPPGRRRDRRGRCALLP